MLRVTTAALAAAMQEQETSDDKMRHVLASNVLGEVDAAVLEYWDRPGHTTVREVEDPFAVASEMIRSMRRVFPDGSVEIEVEMGE